VDLTVVAVGRLKAGPERELVSRYHERAQALARKLGLAGPRLVELAESGAGGADTRKTQEGRAILAAVPARHALVVLDEQGTTLTSEAFAAQLGRRRDAGVPGLVFAIGGPDGLAPEVRAAAEQVLSFGAMTMPHQLVRALLLEQLYRACTLLSGHPYHRN
jgi:23S rRNA (pseudouridine1915-N3)-methyltransferase